MASTFHLISSVTCPWVQRAVIMLRAKGVEFDVTYIDLREKPDWFLDISPHGKVPVLKVDDVALFESNAIAEYLDETFEPRLHPTDPIKRAQNRAWTDFLPTFAWGPGLNNLSYCETKEALPEALETARLRVARLEEAIARQRGNDGPYFNDDRLCLVDAAYAPFFQRFAICEKALQTGLLDDFPHVKAWSDALLANEVVTGSVPGEFAQEFDANLERRGAYAHQILIAARAAE
ncbi:MAG: glutathione S-transferase family protein [Hyphomicrobiales bacterium]|nr:glutathione S-transferase family protein [Hyphomicrobiales bacterium]